MGDYVERIINQFPTEISKSDTDLTPAGNNISENVTAKTQVKKKVNSYILQQQEECLCPRYRDWIFIKQSCYCPRGFKKLMRSMG